MRAQRGLNDIRNTERRMRYEHGGRLDDRDRERLEMRLDNLNEEILWSKNRFVDMWQLKSIGKRTGNLYPTHGLGPVCQIMNINRGDKMDYMVSLSNIDFTLGEKAKTYRHLANLDRRCRQPAC